MLRVLYISIFVLLNAFIIWRVLSFLKHCKGWLGSKYSRTGFLISFGFLSVLVIVAHFIQATGSFYWLQRLTGVWLGVLFYSAFYVFLAEMIRWIGRWTRLLPKSFWESQVRLVTAGVLVFLLVFGTAMYGGFHVRDLQTVSYEVKVAKECKDIERLRIVLVADHHLGYVLGAKYMEKMVAEINALEPDLVCFAGDIFNNNYDALDDPEAIKEAWRSIESTYGVYACWGNHDVAEPLFSGFSVQSKDKAFRDRRMETLLEESNIVALSDETILVEDAFYLIGRKDYAKPGDGSASRASIEALTAGLDLDKPVILMDHEPRDLDVIAAAGVDIDLSGHTHAGQMFPMTISSRLMWENDYGVLQKGDMHSVVTSGIGVYGASMRVLTDSEVVVADVHFVNP